MTGYRITGFSSLAEVLQELAHTAVPTVFISGGTDFINNQAGKAAELVIDLSQVADLKYIKECDTKIRIGGATTFTALALSPVINRKVQALAQAAGQVGSVQIRNRATIGGNIASASPAGDSLPVLAACNAVIHTAGPQGRRALTLTEALGGLLDKELIIEIVIPTPVRGYSGFVKLGSRSQVTIAKLSLAASIIYDSNSKRIVSGKAAMGALGPQPVCLPALEQFFANRIWNDTLADDLARVLVETVDALIAGRASHPYKRAAVKGLAHDLTEILVDACGYNKL